MPIPNPPRFYLAHTVCRTLNISKKTLFRWEAQGLIPKVQRDWRQWRLYTDADVAAIQRVMQLKRKTGSTVDLRFFKDFGGKRSRRVAKLYKILYF